MRRLKKVFRKIFGGRERRSRRGKWQPWSSEVGVCLLTSRLAGRRIEKWRTE